MRGLLSLPITTTKSSDAGGEGATFAINIGVVRAPRRSLHFWAEKNQDD